MSLTEQVTKIEVLTRVPQGYHREDVVSALLMTQHERSLLTYRDAAHNQTTGGVSVRFTYPKGAGRAEVTDAINRLASCPLLDVEVMTNLDQS